MKWIKAHLKAVAAAAGFVAAAIVGVADGGIHGVTEWTVVLVALANAVQVYITPNLAGGVGKYSKEVSAAVIAVGAALPSVLVGGLDGQEKVMLVCLVLGAFGVVLPNVGYRYAVKRSAYARGGTISAAEFSAHVFRDATTCVCGFEPEDARDWERHRLEAALKAAK